MNKEKPDSQLQILSSRLKSIDFLRGAAAVAVVLHHAITYSEHPPTNVFWFQIIYSIVTCGALGVPLFFVISGFCIHLRWAKMHAETGQSQLRFLDFWKRRIHRLYPPYLVMLCLSMCLVIVAYLLHKDVPLVTNYPQPRLLWIGIDWFAHLTMLHGLHPDLDRAGGNPPLWTLAREEYFYLLYFVLLAWRWRYGLRNSTIIVFILGLIFPALIGLWLSPYSRWWSVINTSAIVLWIQWCLGMVAVEARYGLIKLPYFCRAWWMTPIWATVARLSGTYCPVLLSFCWGMTFFTLLNYCVALECAGRWPNFRLVNWLTRVGIFSYSLYLIHDPVRAVVKQLLGPLAVTSNPISYLMATLTMSVAGYYAAKVFFALVESRFIASVPYETASRSSQGLPQEVGIKVR